LLRREESEMENKCWKINKKEMIPEKLKKPSKDGLTLCQAKDKCMRYHLKLATIIAEMKEDE